MLKDHPLIGRFYRTIGIDDQIGFFGIARVALTDPVERPEGLDPEAEFIHRCDNGQYGPYGFHLWNSELEMCSCGLNIQPDPVMGHHLITLENLARAESIITALPYGCILRFELKQQEDEVECCKVPHSDCARTLQELFRLMLEWDFAHTALGSNEPIAIVCSQMINQLNPSQGIRDWLIQSVPPEKVEKFLLGDQNARERASVDSIPNMQEEFEDWLESIIFNSRGLGGYDEVILGS